MQQVKTVGSVIASLLLVLFLLISMLLYRAVGSQRDRIIRMLTEESGAAETMQEGGGAQANAVSSAGIVIQRCM